MNRRFLSNATLGRAGWGAVCCITALITHGRWRLWYISRLQHACGSRVLWLRSHRGVYGLGSGLREWAWHGAERRRCSLAAISLVVRCTGIWTGSSPRPYRWSWRWDNYVCATCVSAWRSATDWIFTSRGITVSWLGTRVNCRRRSGMRVASQRANNFIW